MADTPQSLSSSDVEFAPDSGLSSSDVEFGQSSGGRVYSTGKTDEDYYREAQDNPLEPAPEKLPPEVNAAIASAPRPQPPSALSTQPSFSAAPPSSWQRLQRAVPAIGQVADVASGLKAPMSSMKPEDVEQLAYPERVFTEEEQKQHPVRTGVDQFAGSMTSPQNILLMQGAGLLGAVPGTVGRLLPRAASAAFTVQQVRQAIDLVPKAKAAWDRGDTGEAKRLATQALLSVGMAGLSARHAATANPRLNITSTPEGTGVSADVLGGEVAAGIARTPEATVIRGRFGSKGGEIRIPRNGAKPPEQPALTPQTIEGELAANPPTRDEIADAQAATDYAGPDQAKAAVVAKRQADRAAASAAPPSGPEGAKAAGAVETRPTPSTPAPAASPAVPATSPATPELTSADVEMQPERRANVQERKRVDQMTPEEMQQELLTSKVTGLPNRRAYDEAEKPAAAGMSDADGLKAFNDKFGYDAGNALLQAKADALREAGLDAYHDKGDEFLYRGASVNDLNDKLEKAREILRNKEISIELKDGSQRTLKGVDFSYGTGQDLSDAETGLKSHKAEREAKGERARGELRGITETPGGIDNEGQRQAGELKRSEVEVNLPPEQQYKHRSTQFNIPEESEAHGALDAARSRISDSDLAGQGKDIGGNHVTVRYGLTAKDDDELTKLKSYISSLSPFEATLGKTEKFPPSESSDNAAVIHAPIESPELQKINKELENHAPFIEPTFKDYRPHATIAYVKPEKADRYVGMNVTHGKKFKVNSIAITDRNGNQDEVKLEGTRVNALKESLDKLGGTSEPLRNTKAGPYEYRSGQFFKDGKLLEDGTDIADAVKALDMPQGKVIEGTLATPPASPAAVEQIKKDLVDLETKRKAVFEEMKKTSPYGQQMTELRQKHNELLRQHQQRQDDLARTTGQPTNAERRAAQKAAEEKSFNDRPQNAMKYGETQQSQHWQVLEPDFIGKRFQQEIDRYNRAIPEQEQKIKDLGPKTGAQKVSLEKATLQMWKEIQKRNEERDPRKAQRFKEEYRKLVKEAVSHGRPVPQEVIGQLPEFRLAQDARERYEKGRHTSFANRSAAINDTMQKEEGFKVKRQDGKPITEEQIKEISTGVDEMVKVLGPELRDMMRGTDLTISHTSGKHPFLSDAGGQYHPLDRSISAGINNFLGKPIKALAHETGHWLDYEAGRLLNSKALIRPKGGGPSTETKYVSEADRSTKPLYELARRTMSDTYRVQKLIKTTKLADLPEQEREEIEVMKVVLGPYWHEPRELWARMFEQYVATKSDSGGVSVRTPKQYQEAPAYWPKEAWDKIEPLFDEALKTRMDAMRERYAPTAIKGESEAQPAPVPPPPAEPQRLKSGKEAPHYLRTVPSRAALSRFLSSVKEVGFIGGEQGVREATIYWDPLKQQLVRLGPEATYRPETPVHKVVPEEHGDRFHWLKNQNAVSVQAKFSKPAAEKTPAPTPVETPETPPPGSTEPIAGVSKVTPAEEQFSKDVKKRADSLRQEIAKLQEQTSAPAAYYQDSAKNAAARDERSRNIKRLSEAEKELEQIERANPREVKPPSGAKLPDRTKNKYNFQREYFTQALQPVLDAWKTHLGPRFANAVKNGTKGKFAPPDFPERQVLVDIPGDGHFRVNNDPKVLDKVIRGATKGFANPRVGQGIKPGSAPRISREASEPAKWSYLERMADEAREGNTQGEKDAAFETIENLLGTTPLKELPKPGTTVSYRDAQYFVNGWENADSKQVRLIPVDSDVGKQVKKWLEDGSPTLGQAEKAVISDRVRDVEELAPLYLLQHVADAPEATVRKAPAKEETIGQHLAGESGTFIPSALSPKRVRKLYNDFIDRVINNTLDLGEKYRRVAANDDVIAKMLHEKDHAPRYFRDKAQSNVDYVTKGLSESQTRLAAMMADSDAREYLQANHPGQYEEAENDPLIRAATDKFKEFQEELTALRLSLGWHVRRDLVMHERDEEETVSGENPYVVLDREGNPVADFRKPEQAEAFIEENGNILDHLKRTYPEHLNEPLMGRTDAGPGFSQGSYGGIRPPKPDKKQRLATAQYFYDHGAKDFSGYLQSFTQASHAALNKKIYDQLTSTATPWKEGTAQPPQIVYNGKTYYRPDVALSMKTGIGENRVKNPPEYRAYDPAKDDKLLLKSFEDGWGTLITGKPGIGIHDRWLAPREVTEALDNYDKTRGYDESDSIRRFFQEQIVGLFGPTVHMLNIMRRLSHIVGTGPWDPRVWPYYQKLLFSQELRDRMASGLQDEAIDALSRYGTYTNARDVGSLHAYFLGNLNPFNWVRQTIGKFSKGLLFDPKFMGGVGGMDQKARVLGFDYLRDKERMNEGEASKRVEDGFGNYNRANWTERMKRWAKWLLFPGWDFSSLKWFLRHPVRTALYPAMATIAANLAIHAAGKNKDQDKYDYGYLHYGDRKFRSSLVTESMAMHLAEPLLEAGRALLQGGNANDAIAAAGEGLLRGGGGMAGNLRPDLQAAAEILANRQYLGGTSEIWKDGDANLPGEVFPNRKLDKMGAFAVVKALPAINRFLDNSYSNADVETGVGSVLGVTNYKSGAEERLRTNVAKAAGYAETVKALAERDSQASERFARDPNKAVYLIFHNDLLKLAKDLRDIDTTKLHVGLASGLSSEQRKETIAGLERSRQQLLRSADAVDDAITATKLGLKTAATSSR